MKKSFFNVIILYSCKEGDICIRGAFLINTHSWNITKDFLHLIVSNLNLHHVYNYIEGYGKIHDQTFTKQSSLSRNNDIRQNIHLALNYVSMNTKQLKNIELSIIVFTRLSLYFGIKCAWFSSLLWFPSNRMTNVHHGICKTLCHMTFRHKSSS